MSYYRSSENYQKSWRPVSMADVNRDSVPWSRRMQAEQIFLEKTLEHQLAAAASALSRRVKESDCRAKPQKAPLYTQYPDYPAARACIGLTAIAEFNSYCDAAIGKQWLPALTQLRELSRYDLDQAAFEQTARHVAEAVDNRVCIDHLMRFQHMSVVEAYRLFATAMLDLRFDRLRDLIFAACILGDLVYTLISRVEIREKLHPLTVKILTSLAPVCRRYEENIAECSPDQLPWEGEVLAQELMKALLPFLPAPPKVASPSPPRPQLSPEQRRQLRRNVKKVSMTRPGNPLENLKDISVRGLDEVLPPSIVDENRLQRVMHSLKEENKISTPNISQQSAPEIQSLLSSTSATLKQATDHGEWGDPRAQITHRGKWGDPRADEISNEIRRSLFKPGLVEQKLEITARKTKLFGCDQEGFVNEKVLARSNNVQVVEKIKNSAAAIEKQLKRFKWFGQKDKKTMQRYRYRGSLDPHRLCNLATSSLICRRWNNERVRDYHGRPLVVLAKDGSSSNTANTTFAGQILTAAFLRTRHLARIDVLAADYSSGNRHSPLVQWLYHPVKTSHSGPYGTVAPIASLAVKGQGGNFDVVSISYILQEALKVRKPKQFVHVINITDGKFNNTVAEVRSMVQELREDHELTYSFVILGDFKVDIPEADFVITVPASELTKPLSIAERIAKHINSLVNIRRYKKGRFHGSKKEK